MKFNTIREIQDLRFATPCHYPPHLPRTRRLKGNKAKGITYERVVGRRVAKRWPALISGQWFRFIDANGQGYCQPDHFIVFPDQVLLLECKLTQRDRAFVQINHLYRPVLSYLYQRPVTGVMVCKNLIQETRQLVEDLEDTLSLPGRNHVLHMLP